MKMPIAFVLLAIVSGSSSADESGGENLQLPCSLQIVVETANRSGKTWTTPEHKIGSARDDARKKGYRIRRSENSDFVLVAKTECLTGWADLPPSTENEFCPGDYVKTGSVTLVHRKTGVSRVVEGVRSLESREVIHPSNQEILDRAELARNIDEFRWIMQDYNRARDLYYPGYSFYEDALRKLPSCREMYGP